MPRHALIEDAAASGPGTVQLALRHCPVEVKRSLALAAVNQGLSLREVHLRALESYLGLEPDVVPDTRGSSVS